MLIRTCRAQNLGPIHRKLSYLDPGSFSYLLFFTTVTVRDQTAFTGPAPPPAPAMIDNSPLRAIEVVIQDIDNNRHPEEIEGRDDALRD